MYDSAAYVKEYYDAHVQGKLSGFVEGNPRVEGAWDTVRAWANAPHRILEVGCGIGDISWRMARAWPQAVVVGLDISPNSIEIARKLFEAPNVTFVCGILPCDAVSGTFDLIVLMDVYEHIAPEDRPTLHNALCRLLSERGRIVLSYPSPGYQNYLRAYFPDRLQPIDEDITISVLARLTEETGTEVVFHQERGIWRAGDYIHTVLGRPQPWPAPNTEAPPQATGLRGKVRDALGENAATIRRLRTQMHRQTENVCLKAGRAFTNGRPAWKMSRAERRRRVLDCLGPAVAAALEESS